jgi:soluble lytic murein transglycosylase-like protein
MLLLASGNATAPEGARILIQACLPPAAHEQPDPEPAQARALEPVQQALVDELSRRFRIASEPVAQMVETAFRAAAQVGLDPLLVLAVISVESRFNPIAESVAGAKGLMQIIPRFHIDKLEKHGGEDAVFDPESNILVGSRILQEYVYRTGSLEAGLQFYNGALSDSSAKYAQKVMAERARLEQMLRAVLPQIKL